MLTKEQLNILSVFTGNLFGSLTFREIKELSKQKSNNVVQIALKEFKKQNLVKTKITGDVTTYKLNFENNSVLAYLNLINELNLNKRKIPIGILKEMQKKLSKQTNFFILIVFGSYAKNKATEKSDLDVAVIVDCDERKKDIVPYLETTKRREILKVDYHIFTRKEFLELLLAEHENVGKQIYKNSLIYCGFVEYMRLIDGVKNE